VLPDLSVFWVIFFVLVLTGLLNGLLFKPLQRVIGAREEAIRSARELAERSAAEARAAAAEFDQRTSIARAEIYRQMDDMRKTALGERAETLASTRAEAEAEVARARATLKADAEDARQRLVADADALGAAAADRILGRRAS
jgi:F-type H+-transporting ATPase subunit b